MTKSDHNSIISKFKFEWNTKVKEEKIESFNLKNKDAQQKFKQITSENGILTSIVNKDLSVTKITKKFLKRIEGCKHQSFKKFKYKEDKENQEILELFDRRRVIRNKDDEASKKELKLIEDELATKCAEENYKKIMDEIKDIESDEGGFNMGKLWKLKKKLCPYKSNPPTSMKDPCGNIITGAENLKKHTMNHYESVLKNREIEPGLESMRKEKEELCKKRIELAKFNKSEPWKMDELEVVLKYLKKEKSKDPDGNINELFNSNVAGKDMKVALLTLMNKIKDELEIPTELKSCNISSIYKSGVQSIFDNYRGVFRVTILRTILDRLLYNDVYPIIDSNLTDANVGSRRGRNIRDNLFVLNAVTNSVTKGSEKPCDIGIYDIYKAFDGLWAQECINDFYDAGIKNDKLVLLHLLNESAMVAAKTSKGITHRKDIRNIIMQGTVPAGLYCTTTMDTLAKHAYENKKLLYKYKGVVDVPPLMMVDDIATISECGIASVAMNATVNSFVETKKLKLKFSKCSVIHVGKDTKCCPQLKVHGEKMHVENSAKYLGDIFHKSGKAKFNIIERQNKAYAILAEIRAILEDVPLGKYRTEVGLHLRQAMFINGVLFNSEVWPELSATDLAMISNADHRLIRTICQAHSKTPIEFLYMETAAQPLQYIISSRRLMYLHNILSREEGELVKRVYRAQSDRPTKGDFVELVKADLEMIGATLNENKIQTQTKGEFKSSIKSKIQDAALQYLKTLQIKHKKTEHIQYNNFRIQPYMKDPRFTNSMVSMLFSMRSSMTRGIKANFSAMYRRDLSCPLKCGATDQQSHLMFCPVLLAQLSCDDEKMTRSTMYEDIFGSVDQQLIVIGILSRLMELREELLDKQNSLPVDSSTGPNISALV